MNPKKQLRGRPKLTVGKRNRKLDVRFTEEELKTVDKMVKALGIKRAELIRLRVLGGAEAVVVNALTLMRELDGIGAEFGRAGNNINQLAKYSNILRNKNILSSAITEHFVIQLESYSIHQEALEILLRKILRSINKPAI